MTFSSDSDFLFRSFLDLLDDDAAGSSGRREAGSTPYLE